MPTPRPERIEYGYAHNFQNRQTFHPVPFRRAFLADLFMDSLSSHTDNDVGEKPVSE